MAKKVKRESRSIVIGHLEKVSSKVFDSHHKQITEIIEGNYGVYALYRREKLYYVGKASNLKSRVKQHLKDRHAGKWTHFSAYLIRKTDHINEIEALLLRIADPKGDKVKGKLKGSLNLRPKLKVLLSEDFKRLLEELLGGKKVKKKVAKKRKAKAGKTKRPLAGFFAGGKVIYATYKGKDYKGWVANNGAIRVKGIKGVIYDSPSAAGAAVRKKSTNGWVFWKYKDESGELVSLGDLR